MDLQERRQLDVAERVQRVRAKARPWRYIFALVVAVAGAIAAKAGHISTYHALTTPALTTPASHALTTAVGDQTAKLVYILGTLAFFVFGMIAVFGLSGAAQRALQPLTGRAHAGIVRYVLLIAGVFAILTISLALLGVNPRQLLVGGAVTGVLLGIAAQQSLSNVFAGLVLLFASPFRVGDRVRFRAGALSGQIEGVVTDLSLTYVRLETEDGTVLLPNSQVLASAVMLVPDPPHANEPAP
jgi:small-conductance mechanosensitive channel